MIAAAEQLLAEPARTGDADELAGRQGEHDAPEDRREAAARGRDRHQGGGEREDRQDDRVDPRLQRVAGDQRRGLRHGEAEEHTGDRRVHTGEQHEHPGGDREHDQGDHDHCLGARVQHPAQHREGDDAQECQREREVVEVGREQHGDQYDADDVVEDREGEEEHPDRRRQAATEHGQHSEGERDVGRRRDRPAVLVTSADGEREVDEDRHDHPARRADRRLQRPPGTAQLSAGELVLQLHRHREEEEREQAVRDPVREREVDLGTRDRHVVVEELEHGGARGRIGDDESRRGREQQQQSGESGRTQQFHSTSGRPMLAGAPVALSPGRCDFDETTRR